MARNDIDLPSHSVHEVKIILPFSTPFRYSTYWELQWMSV